MYEAGGDRLVIVASDRLSAFDVVLPTPIPDKGRVLTEVSSFWFDRTERVVPNHLVSTNIDDFPAVFREVPELDGRAVLVKRCERIDVECVARGYISGSGWTEYKALGTVASEALPKGLQESQRLDEPIFTPATKAATGHDVNISRAQLSGMVGSELAKQLEEVTLELYRKAHAYALGRGLILADTKFEFGFYDGKLDAHRRGADPGLVALLGRGDVQAGRLAGVLRQAVRARLPCQQRLEQGAAGARAPARRRRRHEPALPRVLREAHRRGVVRMTYVATIRVLPKAEVRDPQGEAVRGALRSLGLKVSDVRTGKEIVVTFEAADEAAARDAVRVMGNELLANPVIEDYAYELKEGALA